MKYYIGIDLGGTTVKMGIVDNQYHIIAEHQIPTELPKTPDELAKNITMAVNHMIESKGLDKSSILSAGIGMPGVLEPLKGRVVFASNFAFQDVQFSELVSRELCLPVQIENDANTALWGEWLAGSAQGYKNVIMMTLGTGVGGGIIIEGKLYPGFNHLGAEFGHVGMCFEGRQCLCGLKGCTEMYCSVSALISDTKSAMQSNLHSLLWRVCEGNIDKVNGKTCFEAVILGDDTARQVLTQYQKYVGYACCSFINIFQPEILIIGGAISKQGENLIGGVRAYVENFALGQKLSQTTRIRPAKLEGNRAGIIGAAFLHLIDYGK